MTNWKAPPLCHLVTLSKAPPSPIRVSHIIGIAPSKKTGVALESVEKSFRAIFMQNLKRLEIWCTLLGIPHSIEETRKRTCGWEPLV